MLIVDRLLTTHWIAPPGLNRTLVGGRCTEPPRAPGGRTVSAFGVGVTTGFSGVDVTGAFCKLDLLTPLSAFEVVVWFGFFVASSRPLTKYATAKPTAVTASSTIMPNITYIVVFGPPRGVFTTAGFDVGGFHTTVGISCEG